MSRPPELASRIALLRISTQARFSSAVSARSGYVRVVELKTNAFSPPKSSGALSSTENPSSGLPMTISPNGNASC